MEFAASRPDVVRSVSQRWLLKYWTELRGFKPMPLWKDVPVEDLTPQLDTLMFLDVVANGAGPRFLIRFLGQRIAQSYGADFCGRFLDEAIPPAWRDNAMRTYCRAVTSRLPVTPLMAERMAAATSSAVVAVDRSTATRLPTDAPSPAKSNSKITCPFRPSSMVKVSVSASADLATAVKLPVAAAGAMLAVQVLLQVPQTRSLPSSQASPASTTPLPQCSWQVLAPVGPWQV